MKSLRVLVPLDGSPLSASILPAVAGLAPDTVTLLRVNQDRDDVGERIAGELTTVAASDRLRAAGVPHVKILRREGKPAAEILAAAAELDAGVVALATHGRTGFDRLVHGSVAEGVIRASPIPVLTRRATEPPPPDAPPMRLFERVLVPYDGSELAWRAIETLALLCAAGKGRLILVGVVEFDEVRPAVFGAPPPRDLVAEYGELLRQGMLDRLGHAAARARDIGFDVSTDLLTGSIGERLLHWAEKNEPTLIAMGSHGRSGPSRWALGSVTEKVLRATEVPLLICK